MGQLQTAGTLEHGCRISYTVLEVTGWSCFFSLRGDGLDGPVPIFWLPQQNLLLISGSEDSYFKGFLAGQRPNYLRLGEPTSS